MSATLDVLPAETEVLVVGSGAAGLVAALSAATAGARVLVIDAGHRFGGTSALGGGRIWIPVNGTQANRGDSIQAARTYLNQIFDTRYQEMIDAFLLHAPLMKDFVESASSYRFVPCDNYPDYLQHLEGATTGGRALDAEPVALANLVSEAANTLIPPGYLPITHAEWEDWRHPAAFDWELIRRREREGIRTGGPGLVSALLDGAIRAGVTLLAAAELVDLELDDAGAVTGARVRHRGVETTIAVGALVLASGGFDANPELRARLLPAALGASAAAPGNTGVALRIAERHDLATDNLGQGWWMPMMFVPGDTIDGEPFPRALVRERGVPHQIMVNRAGQRFVDESTPYNEFGKAVHRQAEDGSLPNRDPFIVFDEDFRQRYALPGLSATGALPGNMVTAATIGKLAGKIGVDANQLSATIDRWNEFCRDGYDLDFQRGENAYDRYYGDQSLPGNRNLGPVARGPFYAARIYSGTIGSKGGPVTTSHGQVLRYDGTPVSGLYAAGNAAAFWTADGYPGPGATLAVGMTFGHRAGVAAAAYLAKSPHSHTTHLT